jgi:DNA-binding CsgD family transcriptional regulator
MTDELYEALTAREQDVLALLADGYRNREIAERLGISEHTVKFHLAAIFGKLGASTRTEAVRKGLKLGLIEI